MGAGKWCGPRGVRRGGRLRRRDRRRRPGFRAAGAEALTTGRPAWRETQRLSVAPDSISAVAPAGVVVAGIDDDDVFRDSVEKVFGEIADLGFGDGDDDLAGPGGLAGGDEVGAGLVGEFGESLWTARVGDVDIVTERGEAAREGAADVTCADDSDFPVVAAADWGRLRLGDQRGPQSRARQQAACGSYIRRWFPQEPVAGPELSYAAIADSWARM
jgi:hypothetical protein